MTKRKVKEPSALGRPLDDVGLARVEKMLRQKPRTLVELEEACGYTERTVLRWMRELEGRGVAVRRVNRGYPAFYQIG